MQKSENYKMTILKSCDGCYFPSFFTIHLDTDLPPEQYLKENFDSTIVHEYIHFLQDISTTYGLANLSNVLAKIPNFYNLHEKKITLPYIFNYNFGNERLNRDLFNVYYNECKFEKIPQDKINLSLESESTLAYIEDIELLKEKYPSPELCSYTLVITYNGVTKKYPFGTCAIMESMASLIEQHLFPIKKSFFYTPYDLANLVARYIYPEIASKPENIVAICDLSLMYVNSPEFFIGIIERMKASAFIPNKIEDLYLYALSKPEFQYDSYFEQAKKEAYNRIKTIVNVDLEDFIICRDWALESVERAFCARKNKAHFISELMELEPQYAKQKLYNEISENISPLIFNNKNQLCLLGNVEEEKKDKYTYWFLLKPFYEYIFINKSDKCPYNEFCQLCERNDECIINPLLRVGKEDGTQCIFQLFARMFGLYKYTIIN